jgi:hypothetical protein
MKQKRQGSLSRGSSLASVALSVIALVTGLESLDSCRLCAKDFFSLVLTLIVLLFLNVLFLGLEMCDELSVNNEKKKHFILRSCSGLCPSSTC